MTPYSLIAATLLTNKEISKGSDVIFGLLIRG